MKFKVQSKELYSALSSVSKVINSKNAMTILNNFLFDVADDKLVITASDIENTLTACVAISDVEGTGKFCVDGRRSVELFKELPDVGIDFVIDDNLAINIAYPGGKFDFVGIDGNEFPQTLEEASPESQISFTIPAEQMMLGIDNTLFAVGTDDLRPQMMGILLDIKPDAITFVATDTRKLVKYRNWMSAPGQEASCILPIKPANIIKNVFAKQEQLQITLDPKAMTIKSGDFSFNCRFIKGNFPDYNRVIPTNNPYVLTVDRQSMVNAVRRVGVFVDPGHGLVKFRITPELIEMKAQDTNFCTQGREQIPCSFTGENLVIGFSAPFLIDIFNTISTENVVVKLSDPSRPGVFLPEEDAENSELLMLLMPMTVSEF